MLAQKARKNKPWEQSTGPTTPTGKACSARNAKKSGLHTAEIKRLKKLLRQQKKFISYINER